MLIRSILQALDYTIFERIGNSYVSNSSNRLTFNVQVQQINRTNYKLTGNVTFLSSFMRNPNAYYVRIYTTNIQLDFFGQSILSILFFEFHFQKHSINFHINTLEYDQYEKRLDHFPRPTYCEFINTSHRKHIMKTVHSPISNDPYSDDNNNTNDELCYSFRSEHNVIKSN